VVTLYGKLFAPEGVTPEELTPNMSADLIKMVLVLIHKHLN